MVSNKKNLVLFFQTDEKNLAPEQMYEIGFNHLRDTDTDTFHGQGFFSFSSMQPDNFSENSGLMQLRVIFSEMELPKNINISVTLWKNKNTNGEMIRTAGKTFTFPLSLNEFEEPKIYAIDKEIDIAGNKVTFDRMEVYPTGTMLHYRTWKDRQNDLALQFDLMEDGEKTRFSTNFNSTSYEDKYDEHTIRLQDDFFNQPKTRSLLIHGYYMIEEDKEFVTLDVEQGLLSRPLENMELIDVDSQEEKTTLVFRSFDSPAQPPIRSFTDGKGIALRILNTQHRISDNQSSFVYEVETKKTSKLIMRVTPTLTSLGDYAIEIPIPIPSR